MYFEKNKSPTGDIERETNHQLDVWEILPSFKNPPDSGPQKINDKGGPTGEHWEGVQVGDVHVRCR